jgi:hypothetical protein
MVYRTLWFAQHVSGIIMPIIRSLRLYRRPQLVAPHLDWGRLLVWCMAVGLILRVEGCCTSRATSLYPDHMEWKGSRLGEWLNWKMMWEDPVTIIWGSILEFVLFSECKCWDIYADKWLPAIHAVHYKKKSPKVVRFEILTSEIMRTTKRDAISLVDEHIFFETLCCSIL